MMNDGKIPIQNIRISTVNKWLGLILLGIYPMHSYAIENGTSVAWDSNHNDDIIKLYSADEKNECSGTLIAGKYTLTAAHCIVEHDGNHNIISKIKTARGQQDQIVKPNAHLSYGIEESNWHDLAFAELSHSVDATHIHFFADLTKNVFVPDTSIRIFGFGSTKENLHYADFTMTDLGKNPNDRLDGKMVTQAHTIYGDSGAAWLNNNDRIVAAHKGGDNDVLDGVETRETYSTNLFYSSDFILETINGWHYPTLAYTSNGKATITVQSLHDVSYGAVNDVASQTGDVQIVGGTCFTKNIIKPFETCTYEIESTGGQGSIILGHTLDGADEVIHINKPMPKLSDHEGSSIGQFGLLLLSGFGLLRRRNSWLKIHFTA